MTGVATAPHDTFAALAAKITANTAFRCASYKERTLRRRIAVRMRACGATSYDAYARLLDDDVHEYERLLDALTINVTRFFRDRATFDVVAARVIPALWDDPRPMTVWSAGTSSGEEAYTLAALVHDHARGRHAAGGRPATGRGIGIVGTDIDRASLERARAAQYPPGVFAEAPASLLERLFPADANGSRSVASELRSLVAFEHRDLLRDQPPGSDFALVSCRNVVIYFERAAQEEVLSKLHGALRPGGYLLLGRVEAMFGAMRRLFEVVSARDRIYRRLP